MGKQNQHPNPACPVGKKINAELATLYAEAEQKVLNFLGKKTLAEFSIVF